VTSKEIYTKLKDKFGDVILLLQDAVVDSHILVSPEGISDVARYLAEDETLVFDSLMCLSGVDLGVNESDFEVVYHLFSMTHRHRIVLKAVLPKDNSHIPTVEDVWKTATWHERETYDLYGIVFEGHTDLRRILMPDDWEGHPLRKDYKDPEFYRGMRVPY